MARKPNGQDKEAKASDFLLMPPSTSVRSLATERDKMRKANGSRTGSYNSEVAKLVEQKHLDKKGFSIACQLRDLPDEKLAITLPHLLRYIDDFGLEERASKQAEMFGQNESENGAGDDNVHRIGRAARNVAEKAGEAAE